MIKIILFLIKKLITLLFLPFIIIIVVLVILIALIVGILLLIIYCYQNSKDGVTGISHSNTRTRSLGMKKANGSTPAYLVKKLLNVQKTRL